MVSLYAKHLDTSSNIRKLDKMRFDNVLVPIDTSTLSEAAIELAVHSGGDFKTHLYFVFVADVSKYNEFGSIDANMNALKIKTEGKLALENAAKRAEAMGIPYDTILVEGIPWQVISEMSKEKDMIIMGVTGQGGIAAGRVGTTAEKVIENSYCPVLTIKSGSSKFDSILLPIENEHMAAIDIALDSAKNIKGKVTVLAVKGKNDPSALVEKVAARFAAEGINVDTKVAQGNPVDVIVSMSGSYDLVIMGTHKRSMFKKILNGSIAERVMTSAACPVTIVRDID